MIISVQKKELENINIGTIIVGVFEDEQKSIKRIDKKLDNAISKLMKKKEFSGEYGQIHFVNTLGKIKPDKIILLGLGKRKDFCSRKLRNMIGMASKVLKKMKIKKFATDIHYTLPTEKGARCVVEGAILGSYVFEKYKTKKTSQLNEIILISKQNDKKLIKSANKGKIIAESMNYVRDLANEPGSKLTPEKFAQEAKKLAKKYKMKIRIYNKKEIEKLGMGGLLAVNSGSSHEPRFVVIEYKKGKKKIALVGKGITFDSGGLNIKPATAMDGMQGDKAGAATVLGIMRAAAELGIKAHIIGLLPLTDNMPSGNAMKPGDIIKSYNKKSIEIGHTDAEGRLILADALAFAEKMKPNIIIDFATLTGAAIVALGHEFAALLGNNEKLIEKLKHASELSDERVWQLPLVEEHQKAMESKIADVKNISSLTALGPGTIYAAAFLKNFVEKTPWAHLDIAGTAWLPSDNELFVKGATGYGVSLIIEFLESDRYVG